MVDCSLAGGLEPLSTLAALIELERLDLDAVSLDLWCAVSQQGQVWA